MATVATEAGTQFLSPHVQDLLEGDKVASSYGTLSISAFFKSRYVILCSVSAAIGGFLFGFDQGIVSIILGMEQFLDQFPEMDSTKTSSAAFNQGLMTALLELGAAFGALQSGFAADRWSRRYVLVLGAAWFIIGSTLQTASFSYAQLVVGRFVGGIGVGTLACVAPLFIGEIAPPHLRGAMLVFEAWMVCLGVVVAYYVTYATQHIMGDWSFRLPFLVQMIPGILLPFLVMTMPFSPRWLVLKGRDEQALASLAKLRQLPTTDARVQAEWLGIKAEVLSHRIAQEARHPSLKHDDGSGLKREVITWIECFRPDVFPRTIIGIGLQFFQQFIGVTAIIYYATTLFASLGMDRSTQLTFSGITNVMQLAGATPAFMIMDRVGRRPLLLLGSAVCFCCHLISGVIVVRCYQDWSAHPAEARVGVAMLMIFMFVFGLSWAPIPWVMPPEVCASSYRSKAVGLSTISNWVNNFIMGLITPTLIAHSHGYGAFFFFAAFAAMSAAFVWFFVPETKGVSLEQMDAIFHTKAGEEDERRRKAVLAELLNGGSAGGTATPDDKPEEQELKGAEIEQVETSNAPAHTRGKFSTLL